MNDVKAEVLLSIEKQNSSKSYLGFWLYIMSDCVIFATLFATFAVLQGASFGGPTGTDLFSLKFVFIETMILLTSSFTAGLALLAMKARNKRLALQFFAITFLLGLAFLGMELHEFSSFINEGSSWRRSAFMSAFFTLVGTHGLHITAGLTWLSFLFVKIYKNGINKINLKRANLFALFWHFLDIIWIFIFTLVYLRGSL